MCFRELTLEGDELHDYLDITGGIYVTLRTTSFAEKNFPRYNAWSGCKFEKR